MQGNEEAWASTFPVGLKYGDTERGPVHKLGGIPPIRLVPPVHEADESEATVTIKLTNKAKDTYIKFTGGNPETAVRHVKLFYSLVDKLELKLQYETKQETLKANRAILKELGPLSPVSPDEDIKHKEKLDQENTDLVKEMATLKKDYWSLFERLLGASLIPNWQRIVEVETATKGYIGRDGKKVEDKIRGKRFASMEWCVRSWLRKVVKPNAAERHRQYMLSQIVWPATKVGIGPFVDRVIEINTYNKYLPSLKDEEGAPEALVRGNVPFTELELCTIILQALPFGFASAFWSQKGTKHFPVCVKTLKEDLELMEPHYRVTANLVAQVKSSQKGQSKNPTDKEPNCRTLDQPIPRKTDAKASVEAAKSFSSNKPKKVKNCEKCAKWSPELKHTHDTSKCRKWTDDGRSRFGPDRGNFAHSLQQDTFAQCFAQMRKDYKKLSKEVRSSKQKQKRKGKKKRKYYSSSDSSDNSDSE